MRKAALIFSLLFVAMVATLSAATYPQLALGGGYECIVMISNKTDVEWVGHLRVRTGPDANWGTPISVNGLNISGIDSVEIRVAPNATRKLLLRGDDTVRAGYIEIEGESFLDNLGTAISFFFNFSQNGKLLDSTGVPAAEWRPRFTLPVEKGRGINTGFAWSPAPGFSEAIVTATLHDSEGNEVASEAIPMEGHLARFFDEIFDSVPAEFIGRLTLESEQSFYLTALRLEMQDSGFQLTSVPPQ